MTTPDLVLSLDQGTTNTKAVLVAADDAVVATASAPVPVSHPRPGWVEQDPEEIWSSVLTAVRGCSTGVDHRLAGLTLSTQRESVLAWSRRSGRALAPLLGWQDRRTAERWAAPGVDAAALVRSRTGLPIDAMFSAPKIAWLLEHLAGHPVDDLCVGTVDAWLVWRLTGGERHACDAGNASRTLLYDVRELAWSEELLAVFGVPARVLPEVLASDAEFGRTRSVPGLPDGVPIVAVLADSHAALFGQGCTEVGSAKATYGTGTSVMAPEAGFTGRDSPVPTTLAWLTEGPASATPESFWADPGGDDPPKPPRKSFWAREGNILSSGSALAWTAGLLGLPGVRELVALAARVPDAAGVTLVPAFAGLGAPHWHRAARAGLTGMTSGTTPAHVARAALDAVAHQVADVVEVIESDAPPLTLLRADGGATAAGLLMQTQADLLDTPVEVAPVAEVSALGAARMGWQALGAPVRTLDLDPAAVFTPRIGAAERSRRREAWRAEVRRSLDRGSAG